MKCDIELTLSMVAFKWVINKDKFIAIWALLQKLIIKQYGSVKTLGM